MPATTSPNSSSPACATAVTAASYCRRCRPPHAKPTRPGAPSRSHCPPRQKNRPGAPWIDGPVLSSPTLSGHRRRRFSCSGHPWCSCSSTTAPSSPAERAEGFTEHLRVPRPCPIRVPPYPCMVFLPCPTKFRGYCKIRVSQRIPAYPRIPAYQNGSSALSAVSVLPR